MLGRPIRLLPLLGVTLSLLASQAPGQGDPLALQQQAIRRIDGVVESFRKTGELRARMPDLAQAERELAASNQALAARGDWDALALGLIKQGHTQRMQTNWAPAIALYSQAGEAARRAGNVVHQADALAWRALAESSRRNVGQAFTDASLAVRLAETAGDNDVLARALDVLGTAQIAQGDLAGAAATLNREVAVAAQAKDPMAVYFAYLNRSDVYYNTGVKCDFQRDFAPCYQALDRARADLQQALAIARKQGFPALARQTEEFLANVETRRQLVKSQESMHQIVQKTGVFRPTKAGDVLVTERFVTSPGPVPPIVTQFYQEAKRMESQAGGFADVALARNQYIEGADERNARQQRRGARALPESGRHARARPPRAARRPQPRDVPRESDRVLLRRGATAPRAAPLRRGVRDVRALALARHGRPPRQPEARTRAARGAEAVRARRWRCARGSPTSQGELFELASAPDAAKHAPRMASLQAQIRSWRPTSRSSPAASPPTPRGCRSWWWRSRRRSRRCSSRCARSATKCCSTW